MNASMKRMFLKMIGPLLSLLVGCAAPGATGSSVGASTIPSDPTDLDPARAFLSLSEIEPKVERPSAPADLRPLSQRSLKRVEAARELAEDQRYTEATLELERALRYDPNHPELHRALAGIHYQAGNIERARKHALSAVEANPDHAATHMIIGRVRAMDGDNPGAIAAFKTALLCSDFDAASQMAARCHYELASILAEEGYLEAALEQHDAFEKAYTQVSADSAQVSPSPASYADPLLRVVLLERLGRYDRALAEVEKLRRASPDDVALKMRRARLLMKADRFEEALATVRAIPLHQAPDVLELQAEIHDRAGNPEGMVEDLHARITEAPDEQAFLKFTDWLAKRSSPQEAVAELKGYLAKHPDSDGARAKLLDLLIDQALWEEAVDVAAAAIVRRPAIGREIIRRFSPLAEDQQATEELLSSHEKPTTYEVAYLTGAIALTSRRYEEAERRLSRCLELEPGYLPARAALGRACVALYHYDDALRVAARADKDEVEDAELETIQGLANQMLGDSESAELHFRAAIDRDRMATEARFQLANLYLLTRRENQARQQLRLLLELEPAHEEAREVLASLYMREANSREARAQYEELAQATDNPLTRARCEALIKQFDNPAPDLQAYRQDLMKTIEQHGGDAATWTALGESYDQREVDKAWEAFRNALQFERDNERALRGLIAAEQAQLHFEEVAALWERLLPRRPNHHPWRRQLIEAYRVIGETEKALTLAKKMESVEDVSSATRRWYRIVIRDMLWETDRRSEAIAQLKVWAEADSDDSDWVQRLAAAYVADDQAHLAVDLLEQAYKAKPDDDGLLGGLLSALVAAEMPDRADQYALDRLNEDPENENLIRSFIEIQAQSERIDAAMEVFHNWLARTESRLNLQAFMAMLLGSEGRYEQALEMVEKAIDEQVSATAPDQFTLERLNSLLGTLLISAGEYDQAQRLLEGWVNEASERSLRFEYLVMLSACQEALGFSEQAAQTKQRALAMRPDDETLNNDLAYSWIDRGINLDEAEPMIRYALSSRPRQAAYLDTYGWLMYKKGQFAEAKKWLDRALRGEDDGDPVIRDHLGDVYWRLGLPDEAVKQWTESSRVLSERDGEPRSLDEQRVRDTIQQKIDDAKAGRTPAVAPLAASPETQEDANP
ncbi:MAG: tetratricopeptide repeat protein [Phycisphaerales bacterium]|nr:MAG: tetratricopeptide repeat protein [Phycisphaerales bacterium]